MASNTEVKAFVSEVSSPGHMVSAIDFRAFKAEMATVEFPLDDKICWMHSTKPFIVEVTSLRTALAT